MSDHTSFKKQVLIFVVTFKAETTIESVLERIPTEVFSNPLFETEVLVIDDSPDDYTFQKTQEFVTRTGNPKFTVLHNPHNQGYGGNQKIGYYYAIKKNFDAVLLLHGDGQYPPEFIEHMIIPIIKNEAEAVFGSRMMDKMAALRGRMPLYKWLGNQILTGIQNRILNAGLSEFHSGYRAYSVSALKSIPFQFNSNYFDFDTDIIIQLLDNQKQIREIPIPTYYGDEISRVNGIKYGALILKTSILSRLTKWGIFYSPKFDYISENFQYVPKIGHDSSHQFALDKIPIKSKVLDLGCGPGTMAMELSKKQVQTISVDQYITPETEKHSIRTIQADINSLDFDSVPDDVEYILMLDIIEHLNQPEAILKKIRQRYSHKAPQIILTTGNVAFFLIRISLLFGQFNYGKRGILDLTHTRLFTFQSLKRVLADSGFEILQERGIPAPYYLALGSNGLATILLKTNQFLIKLSKNLFSYQIAMIIRPTPTLEVLLENAVQSAQEKTNEG